jgi:pimeloyl-ACP methyl ester carboxylesterase
MISGWQSRDVESNGIRIHYTRTGGDKPALVLAHGVTDHGLCWTSVAELLASDYDVIMVDARGHGRSEATDGGYGPATQAADLHGVIEALGLQRPILLGHSLGAITSLALAGLYPTVPRAILLEDPPAFWMPPQEAPATGAARPAPGAWISVLKGKTREELIAEARQQNPSWSEAEIGHWADSKLRVSPKVAAVFTHEGRTLDWPAVASQVICPALAIMADLERGSAISAEAVAALQAMVPNLETVRIAGAGHSVHRDQFDRYMEAVQRFLSKVAA